MIHSTLKIQLSLFFIYGICEIAGKFAKTLKTFRMLAIKEQKQRQIKTDKSFKSLRTDIYRILNFLNWIISIKIDLYTYMKEV